MTFSIAALNLVDYAVIFILIVSAILSTLRGMTREALGLAGWPISIFAAKYTAPVIEPTISDIIPVDGLGDALSWALPFAVAVVLWFIIANVFSPGLKRAGLGSMDHWLGVIFGLIRGYVIVLILYAVAIVIMEGEKNLPDQVGKAQFTPYVRASVISMSGVIPEDMRDRILDNVPDAPATGLGDAINDALEKTTGSNGTSDAVGTKIDLLKDETLNK